MCRCRGFAIHGQFILAGSSGSAEGARGNFPPLMHIQHAQQIIFIIYSLNESCGINFFDNFRYWEYSQGHSHQYIERRHT